MRPRPITAEGLVGQFDALPPRPFPATGGQRRVGLGNVASLGQQQRHRVFGGGDDVALRGIDDHHATSGCRFDIDIVEADSGATDDKQSVGVLENLGRDLGCRTNDQGLCAAMSSSSASRSRRTSTS